MRNVILFAILCAGCGGGGGGNLVPVPQQLAPLLVSAGLVQIQPLLVDTISGGVDLARLGIAEVDAVYDVTTPAGTPFSLDILTRAENNGGLVRVSVASAGDPLPDVGIVTSAPGATSRDPWLDARGDGFARVTLGGAIEADQVIAAETDGATVLIRIRVGPPSEINRPPARDGDYPGVIAQTDVYSSDSVSFGLPTCAISGDRTSIVVYEGDGGDPFALGRFELRVQLDHLTGTVTGGASPESSPDYGHWRDHEIAALFNVLALVHSGEDEVSMRLSFDRGATFGQTATLSRTAHPARLVQIAMAADYSTAVLFWRANELVLVEGRPSRFDGTGSPTRFAFDLPRVLYRAAGDVTPALLGAAWSIGGDLVVGYGFTTWESLPDRRWRSVTEFRCATRLFGGDFVDLLVERNEIVGRDPSVSLLGSGSDLRIFYAYEGADGVRLADSRDGGATWRLQDAAGDRGAHLPTVLAREQDGKARVDLLYLAETEEGRELHLRHWDDFDTTAPGAFRLTRAESSGGVPIIGPPEPFRITQVAWFGYDATLDGDDVIIAWVEETIDGLIAFELPIVLGAPGTVADAASAPGQFIPADPPPLAPGLTEPLRPFDPAQRQRLRVTRLN